MNWYQKNNSILIQKEDNLQKEASLKDILFTILLSAISSGMAVQEAKLIRNWLDKNKINEKELVQQVNKKTIEELDKEDIYKLNPYLAKKESVDIEHRMNPEPSTPMPTTKDLYNLIRKHEGYSKKVYRDTLNNRTIGIGFNLERGDARNILKSVGANYKSVMLGRETLSEYQINQLFNMDLEKAINTAKQYISNFNEQPTIVKMVIIDMAFNMGPTKLNEFKKLRQEIENKDYKSAAMEMSNSLWYQQVGHRGPNLLMMMINTI